MGARPGITSDERERVQAEIDETLLLKIHQVWQANIPVCGADKVWHQLKRQGVAVARCTVKRLMLRSGLKGVRRDKFVRTTPGDAKAVCPLDRFNRQFKADRLNQLWVSDFTPRVFQPGKAANT